VGPTCQSGTKRGECGLRQGSFPMMEAKTGQGVGTARGLVGPGKEGGSLGRSGLARRPRPTELISKGKKSKGF
jgi:hypothetical protein